MSLSLAVAYLCERYGLALSAALAEVVTEFVFVVHCWARQKHHKDRIHSILHRMFLLLFVFLKVDVAYQDGQVRCQFGTDVRANPLRFWRGTA